MFSRTLTTKLKNVPEHIYRQFYRLNRGNEGLMRDRLVKERRSLSDKPSYVHYVYDSNKRVAAWAITWYKKHENNYYSGYHTYFYVKRRYRRRGMGTRLAKASIKVTRPMQNRYPVFYGDARRFFSLPISWSL